MLSIDVFLLHAYLTVGVTSKLSGRSHWINKPQDDVKIELLIYQPSYKFEEFYDAESDRNRAGIVKTDPKLSIYIGKHEYPISGNKLSEAELHWLGQELSDFLDLELQIIYPTPNIPAPVYCASCGCC